MEKNNTIFLVDVPLNQSVEQSWDSKNSDLSRWIAIFPIASMYIYIYMIAIVIIIYNNNDDNNNIHHIFMYHIISIYHIIYISYIYIAYNIEIHCLYTYIIYNH